MCQTSRLMTNTIVKFSEGKKVKNYPNNKSENKN